MCWLFRSSIIARQAVISFCFAAISFIVISKSLSRRSSFVSYVFSSFLTSSAAFIKRSSIPDEYCYIWSSLCRTSSVSMSSYSNSFDFYYSIYPSSFSSLLRLFFVESRFSEVSFCCEVVCFLSWFLCFTKLGIWSFTVLFLFCATQTSTIAMSFRFSLLFSVFSWFRLVFSRIEAANFSLVETESPLSLRSRY